MRASTFIENLRWRLSPSGTRGKRMPKARAARAARDLRHPPFGPLRGSTHLAVGVTESGGRARLSPLGTVDRRRYSLSRFVHDPELVCAQGFKRSALRKHA